MIRLRGHHILCLHGFRGLGYSPEFVANMYAVRDRLLASPDLDVQVCASPDDICAACPHLSDGACTHGEGESRSRTRDLAVLQQLSLSPEDTISWGKLLSMVPNAFADGIKDLCASCPWFSLGYCEEGIGNWESGVRG